MARLGSFDLERDDSRRPSDDANPPDGWPQEVRKLLFEAHEEAAALRSERQALLARAAELERRLEAAHKQVAALTEEVTRLRARPRRGPAPAPPPAAATIAEDRWLTDVTDRAATTLRSGQQTAQALVERAKQRAKEVEQAALEETANMRARAEADAARVLKLANYDAEGVLQGAQASAEELLAEARKAAREVMSELHHRRDALTRDIEMLEARRVSLLQACAGIRRPVEDAIRTLERGGIDPRPPARSPREAVSAAITTARRLSSRATPTESS